MDEQPGTPSAGAPLEGLVVVDLSRVLSGPYCTMMLCDLGATVIKVEEPLVGDEARHFLPLAPGGESAYFAAINRGKKSIALDLKADADRHVLDQLLARADVLVENFRPGVLEKLGLGFAAVSQRHPRLVFASISGFGQTGPYRARPAYDVVVQAMSGMMSITGHRADEPTRSGSSIGDLAAAMFMCSGIQSALLQRSRTGMGCHVDVAMFEAQIALLEGAIPHYFCTGIPPGPIGARHSGSAPFDAFKAPGGHIVIAAGSDHLFAALAAVLGAAGLTDQALFATRALRVEHHAELKATIESKLAHGSIAHWLSALEQAGVPAGPLNDVAAMMQDPQVVARGILVPIADDAGQRAPVTPIAFSGHGYPAQLPPVPRLDQHRETILRFAQGHIAALD